MKDLPLDPFHSSVSADERLRAIRQFSAQDCLNAFECDDAHPYLQNTVRKALNARLRKLNKTETDKAIRAAIDAALKVRTEC